MSQYRKEEAGLAYILQIENIIIPLFSTFGFRFKIKTRGFLFKKFQSTRFSTFKIHFEMVTSPEKTYRINSFLSSLRNAPADAYMPGKPLELPYPQ